MGRRRKLQRRRNILKRDHFNASNPNQIKKITQKEKNKETKRRRSLRTRSKPSNQTHSLTKRRRPRQEYP